MTRRIVAAVAVAIVLTTSAAAGTHPAAADTAPGGAKMPTPLHSFVVAAHNDFLGRHPSAQELRYLHQIATQRGKSALLRSMSSSEAWVSAIVTRFYRDTLGRDPDTAGLAHWRTQISTGRISVAGVAARFYASDEYFQGMGGGTTSSWITDLYVKLLERSPDPDGLAWWVERTGTQGRTRVAAEMYQSMESRRQRVTVLYESLLDRAPDDAGRDYWAGRILREGDLALAVNLAASGEYAALALGRFPAFTYRRTARPAGDDFSDATMINDGGLIAGSSYRWEDEAEDVVTERGFVAGIDGSGIRIIPPVPGTTDLYPRGMNDGGTVVGCSYSPPDTDELPACRAFSYDSVSRVTTDVHQLAAGGHATSEAIDVTDDGVVLLAFEDGTAALYDAEGSTVTPIPPPPGGPDGCAPLAMSDGVGRYIVGSCDDGDSGRAWIHDRSTGVTTEIPVPAGHDAIAALDVNSSGTAAITLLRSTATSEVFGAFTYRASTGQLTRIAIPDSAFAFAINEHGTVVGQAFDDSFSTFLWDPDTRQSTYLDGLDYLMSWLSPDVINDAGQLVGSDQRSRPVILG